MLHAESFFQGADHLQLYYQAWRPDTEPRAVIVIVHGVGEHCGRYMNVVDSLTAQGCAVYGYDQRGHGRSSGPRVHIQRWAEYREDLHDFLNMIRDQQPGKPIFLYGHSMGALVVLDYLLVYPQGLRGAIISGAPIVPAGVGNPYKIALARVLTHILPGLSLTLGLAENALSRDPQVAIANKADPLICYTVTVRWGTESLDALARVKARIAEISIPILLLHGEADRLNLAQGSRYIFDTLTKSDKTLRIYPGGLHEPHNDLDHEQVMADISQWLRRLT